jgi:hypothetical protein
MRLVLLAAALCGCAYKPGSFSHLQQEFPGQRTTVGCIDLAVERRPDLSSGGSVLAYEFGNRCDHPATVDLANAHVLAQLDDGTRTRMYPWDPNDEIRELQIDGRGAGAEALAYPANAHVYQICVDGASVTHEARARWLCFTSPRQAGQLAQVSR